MLLIIPSTAPFLHSVHGLRESQRFGHCLIWGEKIIVTILISYSGKIIMGKIPKMTERLKECGHFGILPAS
jgi:hypothetical protein